MFFFAYLGTDALARSAETETGQPARHHRRRVVESNVTHSTIVTYKYGNDIRVTYHTTDTLNRSIWDIYYDANHRNWRYYALRT